MLDHTNDFVSKLVDLGDSETTVSLVVLEIHNTFGCAEMDFTIKVVNETLGKNEEIPFYFILEGKELVLSDNLWDFIKTSINDVLVKGDSEIE